MTTNDSDEARADSGKAPASGSGTAPKRAPRRRIPAAPDTAPGLPAAALATAAARGADDAPRSDPPGGLTVLPDIDDDGSWIEADAVEIHQGAAGRVDATTVSVTQGAIGAAKADHVDVHMGAVGVALGGDVIVSQGMAGTVLAGEAHLDQAFVRTLVAREVTVTRPSAVVFLVAQKVSGEIKVLLDWRGALAFGAAFGVLAGLLGRSRRRD
jgi:hypothetical protein